MYEQFQSSGLTYAFEKSCLQRTFNESSQEEVLCLAPCQRQSHILPLALVFMWVCYYSTHKQFSLFAAVCLKFQHLRIWSDLDQTFQGTKHVSPLLSTSMTRGGLWSLVNKPVVHTHHPRRARCLHGSGSMSRVVNHPVLVVWFVYFFFSEITRNLYLVPLGRGFYIMRLRMCIVCPKAWHMKLCLIVKNLLTR